MRPEFGNLDAILKDEDDFVTVTFQSDKAKEKAKEVFGDKLTENDDYLSIDISITSKQHVITWLISHDLTSAEF